MFMVNPQYARFFVDDPVGHRLLAAAAATTGGISDHPQNRDFRGANHGDPAYRDPVPAGGRRDGLGRAARGGWRSRGVDRLAPAQAAGPEFLPSPAFIWRELVSRIGSAVPASARALPQLKRRLVRAGFRNPNAARYFQGIRLWLPGCSRARGLLAAWQSQASPDNLLLGGGAAAALGYVAPMQYVLLRVRRRQHAIARGLPNALDLMVVCVESGLGIDQTTLQVAKELQSAHPEICERVHR